jgi:hypothetical protein
VKSSLISVPIYIGQEKKPLLSFKPEPSRYILTRSQGPNRPRRTHDITNDGVYYLAKAIKAYESLSALLILYPVDENEIPDWFESNVIDLLEPIVEKLDFDLSRMPQITSVPYEAKDGASGKKRALRAWMESMQFYGVM